MERIQFKLLICFAFSIFNFSFSIAQVPVSTYSDKCGDWKDNIIKYTQPPVTGFNEKLSCLKIYENRQYTRIDAATHLKGDTTLVVIDNPGSEYGKALKAAFHNYWKYTPYAFITPFQVSWFAHKKGYSLFMLVRDESFEEVNTDQHGLVSANSESHLHYKTDTVQHKPKPGFRLGIEGKTASTYIYMLALSSGMGGKDTSEAVITTGFSVADYCIADKNADCWQNAEKSVMPMLNKVVDNFEKDIEYMSARKAEKVGFIQPESYVMRYKGYDIKYSMNIIAFEGLKETWVHKTLYINKMLCNDMGAVLIAKLLGLDESNVKLVSQSFLDSIYKTQGGVNASNQAVSRPLSGSYNDIMIWDTARDEAGDYMIKAADGTELIGLDVGAVNRICKINRGDQFVGPYETEKCELHSNDKSYTFKFSFVCFGNSSKNLLKDKALLINNGCADELGRSIISKMLGMDDAKVRLVPKSAIDSCIQTGDSNIVLLADTAKDEFHNYRITTTNRVELIGLHSKGNNKEIGDIDIMGADDWADRKRFSLYR